MQPGLYWEFYGTNFSDRCLYFELCLAENTLVIQEINRVSQLCVPQFYYEALSCGMLPSECDTALSDFCSTKRANVTQSLHRGAQKVKKRNISTSITLSPSLVVCCTLDDLARK